MKKAFWILSGLVAVTLALSGCGGNGGNDSAGPQSSKKTVSTYTINFDLNGGTSVSHGTASGYSVTVEVLTSEAFFFDCVKDGYNFRGWSYNGTKVFDEKGNQLAKPEMSSSMTFVALYAQTAKMSIVRNMPEAGTVTGEGEYPYNTYVDVSAKAKQGYEFVGWYFEDTLLSNTGDYKYMMWSEDVTLEARFKLASFLLDVRSNDEGYGLVLLKSSAPRDYKPEYQERRDYMTDVTIAAYSKTDVRFLGWYDESNSLVETNAVYNFAMPGHDYVLEAKWNHFNVAYNLNGGVNDPSNPDHYTVESGKITLKSPTKTGYDFLGWQRNGEYVAEIDPSWMEGVTLNAIWEATDYSITYELNGGSNDPGNPSGYTVESGPIAFKPASRKGYAFLGWYDGPSFSRKVNGVPAGSHGDVTVYAKWEAISYSVTYNLNGGVNDPSNPRFYTVEFGKITLKNPTKEGYDFVGWQLNGEYIAEIDPSWMESVTLEAVWDVALNELIVTSEDSSKGTAAVVSGSGYTGEIVTVEATPAAGYSFGGWFHNSAWVSGEAIYTFTMPACDYDLTARFLSSFNEIGQLIAGSKATVRGTIAAVTKGGAIVHDGTGGIYVFSSAAASYNVGDYVEVSGGVSSYHDALQFAFNDKTAPVSVKKIEGTAPVVPAAVELTAAMAQDMKEHMQDKPAQVQEYSWVGVAGKSASGFDALNMPGVNIDIEPLDTREDLTFETGKAYKVKGYITGYCTKYSYIMVYLTSLEETELEPASVAVACV